MQIKLDAKGHLFSLSRQPALSPTNPYQNKTRNTSNFCSTHTNPYKLIPPYTPFPFQIKFLNHSHQLLIFQPLPQFPRNPPQILQCNHPLVIRIKQRKSPQYLVPRIPLTNQFRSNSLETRERQSEASRRKRFVRVEWVVGCRVGSSEGVLWSGWRLRWGVGGSERGDAVGGEEGENF